MSFGASMVLALLLAPVMVWAGMMWFRRPGLAMGVGVASSVLSLTQFFPNSLRYALAMSLVPHAITALYMVSNRTSPNRHLRFPAMLPVLIYVGMCLLSTLWSLSPVQTLVSTFAWLVLFVFALTFRQVLPVQRIRSITFYILLVFFLASVLALATPWGWNGGRARGVFQNANAASIFVFLLAGLSIWMGKKYYRWVLPLCVIFTFLSGSRAGMLALITVVVVAFYARLSRLQKFLALVFALLTAFPVGNAVLSFITSGKSNAILLRTDNTREDTIIQAVDFIRTHPWLGAGYRATPAGLGSSSYLKMLAEFGFLAVFAAFVLIIAYVAWSKVDPVMLGITCATLIDCAFEDWLLTAGAPMLLIFFLLLMSTPQSLKPGMEPPPPPAKKSMTLRSMLRPATPGRVWA